MLRRRPANPAAAWFATMMGLEVLGHLLGTLPDVLGAVDGPVVAVAWSRGTEWFVLAAAGVVGLELAVRLPAGGVEDRLRQAVRVSWLLLAVVPFAYAAQPLIPVPPYAGEATIPNPLHATALDVAAGPFAFVQGVTDALWGLAFLIIIVRYLRSEPAVRRRLRWMLMAVLVAVGISVTVVIFPDAPTTVLSLLSASAVAAVPVFTAVTVLGPDNVDVDHVLRRSLVYGLMWFAIAGLYVAAGSAVGTAAGRRLPAFAAALLTVVATLAFHPIRRRLEELADRWVFGSRADPTNIVAGLGAALEATYDVDSLLPVVEDTLRRGLSVEWARVRLELPGGTARRDESEDDVAMAVAIVHGDEHLGIVECGPRRGRPLGPDDEIVLKTFARQAAMAIANVRLTSELSAKARELGESRARLVRAQETERRRIERNIHDGVQQELVALIQQAGEVEASHAAGNGGAADGGELTQLREGLTHLLTTLRELAAGIHPSLLSDRGLLPAVEALAARHPVPVQVRVDRSLRDRRFAEAIEGAGYFTVAEGLANSLKHARASRVDVTLGRENGSLLVTVEDDGDGVPTRGVGRGQGLINLRERLTALGGGLVIDSSPGEGTRLRASMSLHDEPAGGA